LKKLLSFLLVAMLFVINILPVHAASVISLQAQLDKSAVTSGSAITISGKVMKDGAPTQAVSPTMAVIDPAGNYVYTYQWNAPQEIGVDGSFSTVYRLAEKAVTGEYSVVIRSGEAIQTLGFSVVPAGKITVATDKNHYYENQTVNISGQVTLNGVAVNQTDVTVKVTNGNQVVKLIDQVKTNAQGAYQSTYILPTTVTNEVYSIEVAAIGVKETASFSVSPEPPGTLSNFTGIATTTSITLTWDAASRASVYVLKRNGVQVYEGSALTFTDNGLTPDTSYSYELVASNAGGATAPKALTVKTIKLAPTAPIGFAYTATTSSINLTWNTVAGAEYYELKRNGVVVYSGINTSYADNNLASGTTYSYELKAINTGGASSVVTLSASTQTVTSPPPPPPPPSTTPSQPAVPGAITNFEGEATTNSITLTWDASERATSYMLKRNGQTIYEGTALMYTDKGLVANKSYQYQLFAVNAAGQSPVVTLSVTTQKEKPANVTNLRVASSENLVSLSWRRATYAEYYIVTVNGKVLYKGTNNSFTHKGLTPNTSYTYSVIAGNSSGESDAQSITIKTKQIESKTIVTTSKSVYMLNEKVVVTINVTDKNKKAVTSANVTTIVTDPKGKVKTYSGKTNKNGLLVLEIKTTKSSLKGTYKIKTSTKFSSKDAYRNSSASISYTLK
jgi:chitodextrinase